MIMKIGDPWDLPKGDIRIGAGPSTLEKVRLDDRAPWRELDRSHSAPEDDHEPVTMPGPQGTCWIGQCSYGFFDEHVLVIDLRVFVHDVELTAADKLHPEDDVTHASSPEAARASD